MNTNRTSSDLADGQAFVYLDVDNPVVAWSAARGVLVSARQVESKFEHDALPLSLMMAGMLEIDGNPRYANELVIEEARRHFGPRETSSRIWGMFCFPELASARRASEIWKHYFQSDNLVAVRVQGVGLQQRFDSNWITYAPLTERRTLDLTQLDWLREYWSGNPYPGREPVWEVIIDGELTILGTQLRQRAYAQAADTFPHSKALLELARIAAWIGFDLGNIAPFLFDEGDRWACRYYMDMTDAHDGSFLKELKVHFDSGGAVNHDFLKDFYRSQGDLGRAPDLKPYSFSRLKAGA